MSGRLKPKILGDVKFGGRWRAAGSDPRQIWRDSFGRLPVRLNLSYKPVRRIEPKRFLKFLVGVWVIAAFFAGLASAPTGLVKAQSSASSTAERQALETQLSELENQINQYEGQVAGFQKQGKTLTTEINALNNQIAKLNLQIQAINLTLGDLDSQINTTQNQITDTEISIDDHKAALAELIMSLYMSEKTSLVQIFLANPRLSDFFNDLNSISLLQDGVRQAVEKITDLHSQLQDKQNQFLLAKADAESVQNYENVQKQQIASVKGEKNQLLTVTKGQESKYQALLAQSKASAAEIRSRIFQLLGGGELTFEQAYRYAKLASGATGIKASLILAVLDRESALGQNVGKCGYKTAMSPPNQTLFLQLVGELGLNPDVMTVSCPNRDGVYGGAMGPAQFVPSTWNLYSDEVAKITGHTPASPWNNADAFVATALYLEDSMTGCNAIYSSQVSRDRCAAAKYYAGSRWRSYLWTYGQAVVDRAQGFEEDIQTITTG